jgi:hypothetical protein
MEYLLNYNPPKIKNDISHLQLYIGPENSPSDKIQGDRNAEIRHLKEQAEIEAYWAGRNLAERHSTRIAA